MTDKSSRSSVIRIAAAVVIAIVVVVIAVVMIQRQRDDSEQSVQDQLSEASSSASTESERGPGGGEWTTGGRTTAPTSDSADKDSTTVERSGPQGSGNFGKDPVEDSTRTAMTDAANKFSVAFFETDFTSNEQVQSTLSPMSTSGMAEKLKTIAFYNMIRDVVLVDQTSVFSTGTSDALVDTYTEGGYNLRVYLLNEDGGWKVSDYGIRRDNR